MPNEEHSTLTGSALHEPKGVASAAANRVYVSDGVGSGTWAQVTSPVLDIAVNAFQGQLFHIQDEKAFTTHGGSCTATTYMTRDLNTVKTNEITGASLSSNQITLPAGTYWVEASAPSFGSGGHRLKLYNVTDATNTLVGTTENVGTTTPTTTRSIIKGRFTIASAKVFELRHINEITRSSTGLGIAVGLDGALVEVYSIICIWKTA